HLSAPPQATPYGDLKSIDYRVVFGLPNEAGQLTLRVRNALRRVDNVPLLAMDVVARGRLGEDARTTRGEWFALAHNTIVTGFAAFAGEEVQRTEWKRQS